MLQLIEQNHSPRIRVEEGLSFIQLENLKSVEKEQLLNCQGILLQTSSESTAASLIQWLRSHQEARIALKPLFLPELLRNKRLLESQADGFYNDYHFKQTLSKTQQINRLLATINWKANAVNSYQSETILRLLRFLYSREMSIQPQPSRYSKIGYSYSFLSNYYSDEQAEESLNIIDTARKEGLLTGNLSDSIHVCQHCSGNYLNFREACTHCSSIDLRTENIIHHFVCAHVAPESTFIQGDELVCPKCDKSLRHIGIDYDKPSVIHQCNSCNHESQQTEMKAKCIDCQTESTLGDLLEHPIYELELTAAGKHRAISGYETAVAASAHQEFDLSVFQLLLQQEGARVQKTKGSSVYGKCSIQDKALDRLNPQMSQLLQAEILEVLQNHLESPEIVISDAPFSFVFLLPEYGWQSGLEKGKKLKAHLTNLLGDNLSIPQEHIQLQLKLVERFSSLDDLEDERITA